MTTALLLHCDGANGSTSFPDAAGHSITAYGSAAVSTAQSKFGGGSLALGSSTANCLKSAASNDFRISSVFTIDFQVYLTAYNASGGRLLSACGGTVAFNSTDGIHWLIQATGTGLSFSWWNGTTTIAIALPVALGDFHHIAIVGDGASVKGYVDGDLSATWVDGAWGLPSATPTLAIGAIHGEAETSTYTASGYIDEVRILTDQAAWTSDFTPPSAAHIIGLVGVASGITSTGIGVALFPPRAIGFKSTSFGAPYAKATFLASGIQGVAFGEPIGVTGWTPTLKHGRAVGIGSTRFGIAATLKKFIATGIHSTHIGSMTALTNGKTGFAVGFKSPNLGTAVAHYVIPHVASGFSSTHAGSATAKYSHRVDGFCSTGVGVASTSRPKWLDYDTLFVKHTPMEMVVRGH